MGEIFARIAAISLITVLFGSVIYFCVISYLSWKDFRAFYKKFNEFVEEFKKQK